MPFGSMILLPRYCSFGFCLRFVSTVNLFDILKHILKVDVEYRKLNYREAKSAVLRVRKLHFI